VFIRIGKTLLETAELLPLGDLEKQLDKDHPSIDKRLLEFIDLPVGTLPLCLGGKSLDSLHKHPSVPGTVKDRHLPAGGSLFQNLQGT
jgi:hypothetical protein